MTLVKRLALIGTGLIGGSLALDWRAAGAVQEVAGWDASPVALEQALACGIISKKAAGPEEAAAGADLVLVAAPVKATCDLAARLGPKLKSGQVVTDVASVKAPVVAAWERYLPPGVEFVGGHPLAGSEKAGPRAARRGLFQGAAFVLTPARTASSRATGLVASLVRLAGANPVFLPAERHDALVAAVSHLPHLSAVALVNTAFELAGDALDLSAGGFADTTRIALGSPVMWRDICLTNRDAILDALDRFSRQMARVRALVAAGKAAELEELFAGARAIRSQLTGVKEETVCAFSPPANPMVRPS
ncbi:MAG: prephenate dehydrogenase [Bacillota bacterium]|jgi:prephenate dehydrogenase|nr:prephenate dehydrogenase [Bacillota bacterium]MDK2925540.1 prephenate dehydrogenase [Bacillota bacterium]